MRKPNILLHNIVHLTDMFTFRCKLPDWENDTFSPFSDLVKYILIIMRLLSVKNMCLINQCTGESLSINRLVKHYDKFGL